MRKDKIFELRIEDDDDISGVDQISLVDEPAIEVNWIAFKKEKSDFIKVSLDYDDTLSTPRGQALARRLLNQGDDVFIVTRRQRALSSPVYRVADELGIPRNRVHFTEGRLKWNKLKELGIQKHYDNNPDEIKAIEENAPLIKAEKFIDECPQATQDIALNLANRQKAIDSAHYGPLNPSLPNDDYWEAKANQFNTSVEEAKSARCANCAFFNQTKKILECIAQGIGEGTAADPFDTIDAGNVGYCEAFDFKCAGARTCDAWLAGGPVTDDFEYDVSTIKGYVDPGLSGDTFPPYLEFESHSDYPDSVKNNAKAVLKYAEENGWGSCGTAVGKQRANQLANGEPISEDTIRRMYSYLSRHEVDLDSSKGYGDGCGKLMYDAWGGKSALSWAEAKIKAIEREKMSKQVFATDEEKRIVIGPAMIPDKKIFRKDKNGDPYYVFFTKETIKQIAEKFLKNKYVDNSDTQHNGEVEKDVYVIESWIKDDMYYDKANKYGFGDLPVGSWFVALKINNDKVWQKIKAGELKGFSVSGYFEEVAQFTKEEMFLQKVVEILKDVEN